MVPNQRPSAWQERVRTCLAERRGDGLLRELACISERRGVEVKLDGRWLVNFCSNNYLDLNSDPRMIRAWQQAAADWGVGSGASPLVSGRMAVHARLEESLAAFCGREQALLFPAGFQANLGVITALVSGREDDIVMDRLCHASLIDAARLSRGRLRRFRHGDSGDLERVLQQAGDGLSLVVSESVYSMDGDIAPLTEYARLSREHGALLFVDEAHAFGVLGETGRGALELQGLEPGDAPLMMATFGKALGVAGAFVAGTAEMIDFLVQRARPFIYSTAMPPAVAAVVLESLQLLRSEPDRRQRLARSIELFRELGRQQGLPLSKSITPIQPIIIGSAARALKVSKGLYDKGFLVPAIRPPTVPADSARLRITLSSGHGPEQIEALVSGLAGSLKGGA